MQTKPQLQLPDGFAYDFGEYIYIFTDTELQVWFRRTQKIYKRVTYQAIKNVEIYTESLNSRSHYSEYSTAYCTINNNIVVRAEYASYDMHNKKTYDAFLQKLYEKLLVANIDCEVRVGNWWWFVGTSLRLSFVGVIILGFCGFSLNETAATHIGILLILLVCIGIFVYFFAPRNYAIGELPKKMLII